MEDAKDKVKGFVKNLTSSSSSSKFKGQGRVLGSSSSSASSLTANSRLIPPAKPNPNPNPNPNCKPSTPEPETAAINGYETPASVAESVSLFLSGEPPKESVEIVLKLLGNVVREPENDKFRRIRLGNPKIKEAIGDVVGGVEVLESVGFVIGEEGGERWGKMEVLTKDGVRVVRDAVALLQRWRDGGGVKEGSGGDGYEEVGGGGKKKAIDRQIRVFFSVPESVAAKIDLPDSFYNLSAVEVKREAELRRKKMEESQLLIPKSFKEKQAIAARKKYKMTVIRVQFPDGVVLQGIFLPSEPTTALYEFVSSSMKEQSLEFDLLSPAVAKLRVIPRFTTVGDRRPPTLEEERLVPSALVKFKPIETDSVVFTGLTNELLEASEPLTSETNIL